MPSMMTKQWLARAKGVCVVRVNAMLQRLVLEAVVRAAQSMFCPKEVE